MSGAMHFPLREEILPEQFAAIKEFLPGERPNQGIRAESGRGDASGKRNGAPESGNGPPNEKKENRSRTIFSPRSLFWFIFFLREKKAQKAHFPSPQYKEIDKVKTFTRIG